MPTQNVVSKEEWVAKRKELLVKEKELTRQRDQVTKLRQSLPWVKVEKNYEFEGPDKTESLSDLFAGKRQLIVYHFMFQSDWTEGCKSCSLIADHYEPSLSHLRARDTNMVTISRADIDRIELFRQRMGWNFKWVSSAKSDFNFDFNVSFSTNLAEQKEVYYNYQVGSGFPSTEGPGMSVFLKDDDGSIYHTYSCFSRGLEDFLGIYRLLDISPKGRDEDDLVYGMEWVRHHDRYGDETFKDIYLELLAPRHRDK